MWQHRASNVYQFSLRWPPGFTLPTSVYCLCSSHLELTHPGVELGPVLLLGPLAIYYSVRCIKRGAWITCQPWDRGIAVDAFPFFIAYGVDRSTTRLPATGLWLWLVICVPLLWRVAITRRPMDSGSVGDILWYVCIRLADHFWGSVDYHAQSPEYLFYKSSRRTFCAASIMTFCPRSPDLG